MPIYEHFYPILINQTVSAQLPILHELPMDYLCIICKLYCAVCN